MNRPLLSLGDLTVESADRRARRHAADAYHPTVVDTRVAYGRYAKALRGFALQHATPRCVISAA